MLYWLYTDVNGSFNKLWSLSVWSDVIDFVNSDEFVKLHGLTGWFNVSELHRDECEGEECTPAIELMNCRSINECYELTIDDEVIGYESIEIGLEKCLWKVFMKWSETSGGISYIAFDLDDLASDIQAIMRKSEVEIEFDLAATPDECIQLLSSLRFATIAKSPELEEDTTFRSLINHESIEDYEFGGRAKRLFIESIPEGHAALLIKVQESQSHSLVRLYHHVKSRKVSIKTSDSGSANHVFSIVHRINDDSEWEGHLFHFFIEMFQGQREFFANGTQGAYSQNGIMWIDIPLVTVNLFDVISLEQLETLCAGKHVMIDLREVGGFDALLEKAPKGMDRLPMSFETMDRKSFFSDLSDSSEFDDITSK